MKGTLFCILVVGWSIFAWNFTAYRDIDQLKQEAPEFIEDRGFCITSYDGYVGSMTLGGMVCYQARDAAGLLYQMSVCEWRGELHLYNLKCKNAISL